MDNMKKGAEEAKQLNQQVKNGSAASFTSSTQYNSPELQEARQLNSQAGSAGPSFTSNASSGTGFSSSGTQEARQLNAQSGFGNTASSSFSSGADSSVLSEVKKQNQQSRQNKSK